ncbi:hypothetical protein M271_01010 [Streptomyces rapamycinicus NRRL 5491]|nr:hypothetical protein M271_01010 [Streptomyces rapamycinicus NRRL 5491]
MWLAVAVVASPAAATGPAATPAPAATSGGTLVVDADTVVRPVTRVGSGSLYGLKAAADSSASVLTPLRLNQLRQLPPGPEHRPNGSPADCSRFSAWT